MDQYQTFIILHNRRPISRLIRPAASGHRFCIFREWRICRSDRGVCRGRDFAEATERSLQ